MTKSVELSVSIGVGGCWCISSSSLVCSGIVVCIFLKRAPSPASVDYATTWCSNWNLVWSGPLFIGFWVFLKGLLILSSKNNYHPLFFMTFFHWGRKYQYAHVTTYQLICIQHFHWGVSIRNQGSEWQPHMCAMMVWIFFCNGVEWCEHGVVNIPISTKVFQKYAGLFFHPCQVQRWCHNMEHIVFWSRTYFFYIGEGYYALRGMNIDRICGFFMNLSWNWYVYMLYLWLKLMVSEE